MLPTIGLVVHLDHTAGIDAQVLEHLVADRALVFELRVTDVDQVQHEIGSHGLLHRRAERGHEVVGQLAKKADRVDDDGLARHVERGALRLRIERGKELVSGFRAAAGELVEERRLAGIRVADQGHREDGVARFPLRVALPLDLHQLPLEVRDAGADDAAVEFELGLADASRTDAAGLPLEVRPSAGEARQQVLELRQLHLRTRFAAASPAGEDVENQAATVDDLRGDDLLQVARLCRRQVVVEDDQRGPEALGELLDLVGFSAADECGRIGRLAAGQYLLDHGPTRGLDQLLQLLQVFFGDAAREFRKDEADGDYFFQHPGDICPTTITYKSSGYDAPMFVVYEVLLVL